MSNAIGEDKIIAEKGAPAELNHFDGMFGAFDKKIIVKIDDLLSAADSKKP